jgi:hypothetical protein
VKGKEAKLTTFAMHTNFASVGTAALIASMTGPLSAGTDNVHRIGNVIRTTEIGFNGTLVGGQSNVIADDPYNSVRVLVLEGNTALLTTNVALFTMSAVISPATIPGLRQIHYDKICDLVPPGRDSTGYMPAVRVFNWSKKISRQIAYTGAAANTDYLNSFCIVMVTDSAIVPHPGFENGSAFVNFVDE